MTDHIKSCTLGWRHWLLTGASCAALALPASSYAQEKQTAQADPNEIIVTAQRRAERLEDVPMAITSVTAESIEKAGITSIHDLGRIAPGVMVKFNGFTTQPSIRGVTSLTNGNGFDNNVAIYVDGFYQPDTVTIAGDLGNIADMQILKGPQGTLYGRNATGGAILIRTLEPSETFTMKGQIGYARFNDFSMGAYVSGPLSDRARVSLAGFHRSSDGYIKMADPLTPGKTNGNASPIKQQSVRAKLEFDVAETLQATLGYNFGYTSDARGLMFQTHAYTPASLNAPPQRGTTPDVASYNRKTYLHGKTHEGTLKLVLDTGIGSLTSYTGYAKRNIGQGFDFDGSYKDQIYNEVPKMDWRTFQQTLDFVLDTSDTLDLVVGATYFWEDREYDPRGVITWQGGNLTVRSNAATDTHAFAAYANATFRPAPRLSLTVGGRWNHEKRGISYAAVNGAGTVTFPQTDKDVTFKKFIPSASIRYELAERTNVYASYSQGFRSGAWNLGGAASPDLLLPIQPENIKAYELGFKTRTGQFRFDVATFYYDYSGFHVTASGPNPLCGCGIIIQVQNAKDAEIYGADGQVTWSPSSRFDLTLGASWLHARYGTFPNATGTGLNPITNLNAGSQIQDWSGKQMSRAPNYSGNLAATYRAPLADGQFEMSANVHYTASFVVSNPSLYGPGNGALSNKQRYRQGSYAAIDAQIAWTAPDQHMTIAAFVRNLTNYRAWEAYTGAAYGDYGIWTPPRVIGGRISFEY